MSFGERLQEVRRINGMTQEEFAAQLKVSRQAVSKWESCRGYPEIEKIIFICNRYGVTMNELFCEEVPGLSPSGPSPDRPKTAEEVRPVPPEPQAGRRRSLKWLAVGSFAVVTLLILLCVKLMRGGSDHMMSMIWLGAIIVFGVVEALTAGLVSIWFAAGAVAALVAAVAGAGLWVQLILFLAVSAATLAATRPLVKKLTANKSVPTNADRVLGTWGKVTETIDNENAAGAVYVDGKLWTARSSDGTVIPAESRVWVLGMEGVKLLVSQTQPCAENKEVSS